MSIDSFRGKYAFLSNFYLSPFTIKNREYKTVEHFFQSCKTEDFEEQEKIRNSKSPSEAKKLGKKVKLRDDWELVKVTFMYLGLLCKFEQSKDLAKKLIDTGDLELIEGNNWNDTYWGVCNGNGKNILGKLLMIIRNKLILEEKN